jgi:hypothetical protein
MAQQLVSHTPETADNTCTTSQNAVFVTHNALLF